MALASYVVPCPTVFRDLVQDVAVSRGLTPSDVAISVLALVPTAQLLGIDDPGDAPPDDRDEIILKSGPRSGKVLRRKPRLQLRLPDGYSHSVIRRALALAVQLNSGTTKLSVTDASANGTRANDRVQGPNTAVADELMAAHSQETKKLQDELLEQRRFSEDLHTMINVLSFDILKPGIQSVSDAKYILGFPPGTRLTRPLVKARFRMLSQIYHPDKPTGDNHRMSLLIEASRYLDQKIALGLA